MSLIAEARAVGASKSKNPCTMQRLQQEDPEYWEELMTALADKDIKVTWIEEVTHDRGKPISETVLGKHRRKQCLQCKDVS